MDETSRTTLKLAAQGLQQGERLRLRVSGASMAPLLRPGETVVAAACQPEEFQVGDLVLIRRGADLVTHRLIGREVQGWITKGDGSPWADPPAAADCLLGRAVALESADRRIPFDTRAWMDRSRLAGRIGWAEHRLLGWLKPPSGALRGWRRMFVGLGRAPFWAAYTIIAALDRRDYERIGSVPHPGE
jgi:hypothetical protein